MQVNNKNKNKKNKVKRVRPYNLRAEATFTSSVTKKRSRLSTPVCTKTTGTAVNPLTNFIVVESRLNDLSNFTTTGGTGGFQDSTTGLGDLTPYALGRTYGSSTTATIVNLEPAIPVGARFIYSDSQPSSLGSTYLAVLAETLNYLHSEEVSVGVASGMSKSEPMQVISSHRKIVEDAEIMDDKDFVSVLRPVAAPPAQLVWQALLLYTLTGANFTVGVAVDIETVTTAKGFSRLPTS